MRESTAPAPLRVLVVEDCRDTATSMATLLGLWGHDAQVAGDGATALGVAAEYGPHAVLLDLGLPGMDGYQVARRLRGECGLGLALVVAVTGYAQEADRR